MTDTKLADELHAALVMYCAHVEGKRSTFSPEVAEQVERCKLHIQALELNMPDPGKVLITGAQADLAKLEQMLGVKPNA